MRISWSACSEKSLANLRGEVLARGRRFGSVTMEDLAAAAPHESTGLYFFSKDGELLYVGRSSSRALIERVPSHLDSRSEAWFGTLLKKLAERRGQSAEPAACVAEALDLNLTVLVANMPEVDLAAAETELRHAFAPTLNSPRKRRQVDLEMKLSDLA